MNSKSRGYFLWLLFLYLNELLLHKRFQTNDFDGDIGKCNELYESTMKISLQKIITPSISLTVLTYIISLAVWVGAYFQYVNPIPMSGYVGHFAESILSSQSLYAHFLGFIMTVLNSLVIMQMNNKYSFIRTRTFMPTFIYLLLSCFWLPVHGNYVAIIASFFVLIAIFLILQMYKDRQAVEQSFLAFFCLAISVFLVPEFVILILFFWIGFSMLKCLTFRTFFASVIGFVVPWILFYGVLMLAFNQTTLFPDVSGIIYHYNLFDYTNIPVIVYSGLMFVIFSIAMVGLTLNVTRENIQARNELVFFRIVAVALILLIIFRFSNITAYLPLVAAVFAILSAYTFTLLKNLFYSIVFIALCVLTFSFGCYHFFI